MIRSLCWPHASCGRMNDTRSCTKPASTKLPCCCFWNKRELAEPHQSPGTSPVYQLVVAFSMQLYLVRGKLTKSHLIMKSGQSDLLLVKWYFSPYHQSCPTVNRVYIMPRLGINNTWYLLSFVSFLAGSAQGTPHGSQSHILTPPSAFWIALPFWAHKRKLEDSLDRQLI